MTTWESIVYINTAEADKLFPALVDIREKLKDGTWGVANAPRPLPGEVTWGGPYLHGIYYAAGPLAIFEKRWAELDGWPVQEISNEEIEVRLRRECAERDITLESIVEDWGGLRQVAGTFGLPWHEAETKMPAGAGGK